MYDHQARLHTKSAVLDYHTWSTQAFGRRTPWGEQGSPALTTAVESALERSLSRQLMAGAGRPTVRRLRAGELLTQQREADDHIALLLDGVLRVEVDGRTIDEIGPGALLGERAGLERGVRTATLRTVTPCTVATAPVDALARGAREQLARAHHRETS